ncbi:MAG: hypothetical protein JO015_08440 [Verrucomicrobia bacterium]|nr:hypothetical protein [Verrucomicrobiota bacterium]
MSADVAREAGRFQNDRFIVNWTLVAIIAALSFAAGVTAAIVWQSNGRQAEERAWMQSPEYLVGQAVRNINGHLGYIGSSDGRSFTVTIGPKPGPWVAAPPHVDGYGTVLVTFHDPKVGPAVSGRGH